MNENNSINVDNLNNPKDFNNILDNDPLFDKEYCYEISGQRLDLRESLIINCIEVLQEALGRARLIEGIDDKNEYEWWDICETLEENIDQAIYDLEEVQSYIARGIQEITPEIIAQDALTKRRKIKIKYLKYIGLTVLLTLYFCFEAYKVTPWLVVLPIFMSVIVIILQVAACSYDIVNNAPLRYREFNSESYRKKFRDYNPMSLT